MQFYSWNMWKFLMFRINHLDKNRKFYAFEKVRTERDIQFLCKCVKSGGQNIQVRSCDHLRANKSKVPSQKNYSLVTLS